MKRSGPIARKTPIRAYTPIRKKRKGKRRRDFAAPSSADVEARNAKLRELGCICCLMDQYRSCVGLELHHPRSGTGGGQKASDLDTLPLGDAHHRGTKHPQVPSIHLAKREFEAIYGTERELLERVNKMIGWPHEIQATQV